MTEPAPRSRPLEGLSVLIVEDQFLIADEMSRVVVSLGGVVIGPAPSVAATCALLVGQTPDLALLDINLDGEHVWAVAQELRNRGVPLIFATGYEPGDLPTPFEGAPHIEKPVSARALAAMVERSGLLQPQGVHR